MSHTESSSPSLSLVAPQPNLARERERTADEAMSARAFLIQLLSREVQLSQRRASWLRSVGSKLADMGLAEPSAECVRLAADTWQQREQLVASLHHVVARWNRGIRRRVEPLDLAEQPPSEVMRAFVALNERALASATPWVELGALAAVEHLLSSAVPLALQLAGCDAHADLVEAAELFVARAARASALSELVAALEADAPTRREAFTTIAAEAVDSFTKINSESAEFGRQLVNWRTR